VRLDTITRDAVQDWVDELHASGMAPSTVANCYHLLSASLKAAVLAGKIAASPCVSIALPRKPPPDERYLTWEEVEAITHFLQPRDSLLVWFLVGTGVRWGEGVGAHRHRLDLERRRLDVHEVWDQRTREVKPYPKGRQKRSVPLPAWLVERLKSYIPDEPARASCGSPHRQGSRCRSGLILPGRDGKVIDYDMWRRTRWLDACAKAKIGDVTIHDLRHTYASWLLQSGVTLEALCDLLGHASLQTTMRYAHLADTQWDAVRAALDAKSATELPQNDQAVGAEDRKVVPFRRPEAQS
jgi:integrase